MIRVSSSALWAAIFVCGTGFSACSGDDGSSTANGGRGGSGGKAGSAGKAGGAGKAGASGAGGSAGVAGSAGSSGGSGTAGGGGQTSDGGPDSSVGGTSGDAGPDSSAGTGGAGTSGAGTSGTSGADGGAGTSGAGGADGGAGTSGAGGADGGAGTSGASGADGGAGTGGDAGPDSGTVTGNPITAPNLSWTWVDFPDSFCRDGSTAGIGVSLNSASKKVMIYLEGGGACFDLLTCIANPTNVALAKGAQTAGVFDRANADNPVKDWNFIYVPFCTGDVHAGTNPNGTIPGVLGTQKFVGYLNMQAFLKRVVPTFPDASQVLLTGVSAGGFGAASNALLVQRSFGTIPVTLIDDSGPPMSSTYLPACLQEKWRTTWGLDGSILQDCGSACPNRNDFVLDYSKLVARTFSDRKGGLIETTGDSIISGFFGYGMNNCTGSLLTPVPAASFEAGLLEIREIMKGIGTNFGTYYISGTGHTWLGGAAFYSQTTASVRMVDWFKNIVNGTAAAHVGP